MSSPPASVYDFSVPLPMGGERPLADFSGQVRLIGTTASRCGFTPQYAGLESLQRRFHAQGFSVLAFPCNQFLAQEPGAAQEIAAFCETNYEISFPVLAKIEVNGKNAHPLFVYLKRAARGIFGSEAIKWNFTKFLIDRQGRVLHRYAPGTPPTRIAAAIAMLCDENTLEDDIYSK